MLTGDREQPLTSFLQSPYWLCTVRLIGYDEDNDKWLPSDPQLLRGQLTHTLQTRTKKLIQKSRGKPTTKP